MKKLYLVYEIINKVNGKIYIGRHVTTKIDDNYMGSGARLKYAKKKYGLSSFEKTILGIFDSEEEMIKAEAEFVSESFLLRNDVYNIRQGGRGGGWESVNKSGKNLRTGSILTEETKRKISIAKKGKKLNLTAERKQQLSENSVSKRPEVKAKISESLKGRIFSDEHRAKISESLKLAHAKRIAGKVFIDT